MPCRRVPGRAARVASGQSHAFFAHGLGGLENDESLNSSIHALLQDLQRIGGSAAAAGLAPQLAELAALVPSERRMGVLRLLMAALRESASWRVRADLAAQLSALARCSPFEVRAFQSCVLTICHGAALN